ncbi:hypothetical protein [Prevotella corporis]|uniref:hypothetical protein n=1 Tax=Prevotella corporis TaxID=28128 RepID=UPI0012B5D0D7|nr:hypothetical protein [Prevotella corporis]
MWKRALCRNTKFLGYDRGLHLTPATEQGEGRSETATTDGIRETGLRKVSFHTVISALSQRKRSAFGLPRLLWQLTGG